MCGGSIPIPSITKEKRKNSEKRKAKSRDAARCRRSRESEIFGDLSDELPFTGPLDKTSVMRLAVGFLKIRHMVRTVVGGLCRGLKDPMDPLYATVLDGFLIVLSEAGDIVYLTENVERFIGLQQVEMLGHSLFDFCHPCDHEDVRSLLAPLDQDARSAFIRMRAPLKARAPQDYQVIRYVGRRLKRPPDDFDDGRFYIGLIGQTIPTQVEMPFDREAFVSRHTPDFKFTFVDESVSKWLGFENSELMDQPLFAFQHAADIPSLQTAYKTLFSKGQCETPCYRFLCKHGGWVWVVTQATLIREDSRPPEGVLCLNYILSRPEQSDAVVSLQQEPKVLLSSTTTALYKPLEEEPLEDLSFEEMSKDFLNFNDTHLNFPDTDILLFQDDSLKDAKDLDLDYFPCSLPDDPFASLSLSDGCGDGLPSLDPVDEFGLDLLQDSDDCYEVTSHFQLTQEDTDVRAPFIPTSNDEDFPLLSPESPSVMWGPQITAHTRSTHPEVTDPQNLQKLPLLNKPQKDKNSSLAALLQSDVKQQRTSKPHRGQVIMLEGAPYRRQPQTRRPHTATVQVRDRLFKVQVSVSELHKPTTNPPKRIKLDYATSQRDSVLLNLLISGEDASRGYLCSAHNRTTSNNKTLQKTTTKEKNNNEYLLQRSDELLVHG